MMLINRNNYENFFLLYADGELNATEHLAVEEFVAANEDLRIELEMIQAAVLPTEEISLIDKSFLYKEIVFDTKLQEKLLLKIDNELPANEMANINALLQTNTAAKKEYDLLSKTKLDANEKIIFADKDLLYKKEKDNVVPFAYWRWAAAAMLIGFALFTGVKIVNNKKDDTIQIATTTNKEVENKITTTQNNIANNTTQNNTTNVIGDTATNNNYKQSFDSKNIVNNNTNENIIVTKENNKRIIDNNEVNKEEVANPNYIIAKEEVLLPKYENVNSTVAENKIEVAVNNISSSEKMFPLEDTYVQQVANVVEDKTDNKIFYVNETKVKNSKLGGFFKKLKKAIEKKANLKPGSSVQVAGFEISAN